MANWESYRVSDVVADIDDRKYVLPVIQRRLVWSFDKMELLFDTLLKGDSFGGIMVIKEEKNNEPLFSFRPFTKTGDPIDSIQVDQLGQSQSFVIDGQQRLQTFYIGLLGSLDGRILYFDLFSNYTAEFEFKFESDHTKLPNVARSDSPKTIKHYLWLPVNSLLKDLKLTSNEKTTAKRIIADRKITNESEKDHVFENVAAFYRNILCNKSLGISEVALDKTFDKAQNRQRIVELFRRLNDGGTRLSPFDLVASLLKSFEWQMEGFLDDTLNDFADIGLDQDNLIKLVFILQDDPTKELTDICATDATFAIAQRQRIKATLSCVRQFLKASELYYFYKDSNRSFVPLFFVAYHMFHKAESDAQLVSYFDDFDANNPEFARIRKWINYSLLNGVFRSKGAGWIPYRTGVRKLLGRIRLSKKADFPVEGLFDVYKAHGVTFTDTFDVSMLDSLDASFIFYLMYDRKQTIRVQDIDHIMPKSRLSDAKVEWNQINSIRNYQLLDYGTNRGEKNASPFKTWLCTKVTDKASFITRHLIPNDESLWDESAFAAFSNERAALIFGKIQTYIL